MGCIVCGNTNSGHNLRLSSGRIIGVNKLDNIGESLKEENTDSEERTGHDNKIPRQMFNLLYSIEGAIILPRVSNLKLGKIYAELYSDI